MPSRVLDEGQQSGSITERKNYRITSMDELDALWTLVHGTDAPPGGVDFSTQEVLAVFDGTHSSGGYDITVEEVTDTGGKRMVRILHSAPADGCATTDAITSPFSLVILSKSSLRVTHEDDMATTSLPLILISRALRYHALHGCARLFSWKESHPDGARAPRPGHRRCAVLS